MLNWQTIATFCVQFALAFGLIGAAIALVLGGSLWPMTGMIVGVSAFLAAFVVMASLRIAQSFGHFRD